MTMAKNLIPFQTRRAPGGVRRSAEEHYYLIFQICGSRYAFEFFSSVTELNAADAQVVPISQGEQRQGQPGSRGRRVASGERLLSRTVTEVQADGLDRANKVGERKGDL